MAKLMLFIDGTWLYASTRKLGQVSGNSDFHVDFGKLPNVLASEVGKQLGAPDLDIVRTYLFGSYASNYDPRDDAAVQQRRDFFAMLKEEFHYEVETFPVNFFGKRLRRADRDPEDDFEPREKCVDIALATAILYYAAIPNAYDVAIVVLGDRDFLPVLQHVRRLGKRVAIASVRGACAPELADPRDEARVKDFDVIWLDELLEELVLKYELHLERCDGPEHQGDRMVWTTYRPRKMQRFFCDACRAAFDRQKQEAQGEFVAAASEPQPVSAAEDTGPLTDLTGVTTTELLTGLRGVVKKKTDRGFGFIGTDTGRDYFFHLTDVLSDLSWESIEEGMEVTFEVKAQPTADRAGAAAEVRILGRNPRAEERLEEEGITG